MSKKRSRPSSDDEVDVRRFIDDMAAVEAEEEEEEEEEEDPDQAQFLVRDDDDDDDEPQDTSEDDHPIRSNHAEEAAEALQQAQEIARRYLSNRVINLPENEFEDDPMHLAARLGMDMYCIDVPARLTDMYINQLQAVNSLPQFKDQDVIHAPFAPLHHPSIKHRKVYFFKSKDVSYEAVRNSSIFLPGGSVSASYVVTARLPPSYTIVPLEDWTSFTSAALPAGSLVRIRVAGIYRGALGYVIGASTDTANECALVAVIPKIKYPDIRHPAEDARRKAHPKKRTKFKSPANLPHLFDPTRLIIRGPKDEVSPSSAAHTIVHEDGFQRYFQTQFPAIDINGVEHRLNLEDFSYRVRQREVDYAVTNDSSSRFNAVNVNVVDKAPPVYQYRGHLYYLGTRIIGIFQRQSLAFNHVFQVHEVLPFVENRLAPDIFDPLISQMHWKRGDKLVDISQTSEYPFYRIHKVDLEEGVVAAHLVFSQADKEDAEELRSAGIPVDVSRLRHEYNLSAFRLRLVVGDHVRVTAGTHKTTCGTIIVSLPDEGYARIIPYDEERNEPISVSACWLETHSGPDVKLSTFHQQSLIQPDCHVPSAGYQGYHINDVVQILPRSKLKGVGGVKSTVSNEKLKDEKYVGRSGRIVGMLDDGRVALQLYPLPPKQDAPSGDEQKEQALEAGEVRGDLPDTPSAEESDRAQAEIIDVDRDTINVILRASTRDYLQVIGVDDYKLDRGEVTEVYNDGSAELRLSDGTVIRVLLNCLRQITPGYIESQHPAVGRELTVWAKKSHWRGRAGTARSHNPILNTFQVAFPTATATFYAQELWFNDGDGEYTCVDLQNGPSRKMTIAIAPSKSPARSPVRTPTPPPDDILPEIAPSGFVVDAGESSIREPTGIDFLAEAWAMQMSDSHHFQLTFLPGYIVGSMVDRQCMTVCPSGFSLGGDRITVKYTDRKNDKHTESVLCRYLGPFGPQKSGGKVVFTQGARVGEVCGVKKANRAAGTLDLITTRQEIIKKQARRICCGVEVHCDGSCRCINFPNP